MSETLDVIIASTGRASTLEATLLGLVTRPTRPHRVIVVGVSDADFPQNQLLAKKCEFHKSPQKGLTSQRNFGLKQLSESTEYVVFLDDDMEVHNSFFDSVVSTFEHNPDVAAFSGNVIINHPMDREQARTRLNSYVIPDGMPYFGELAKSWPGLYGCSMCVRRHVATKEPFDEGLPLYALGEDMEIGFRYRRHGLVGGSARCVVAHLPAASGRVSEFRVGYSQVANYVHFWSKRIGYSFGAMLLHITKAGLANTAYSIFPSFDTKANIDRRGRLRGNLRALIDLVTLRLSPRRILEFK